MSDTQIWHDPIVAEIHATRERLAKEYHNDLAAYSRATEEHCRALGLNVVESLRQRRRVEIEKANEVYAPN